VPALLGGELPASQQARARPKNQSEGPTRELLTVNS
jgi:hypothetical protein